MHFDIPTPFDDWIEPEYSIIKYNENHFFIARDEYSTMWADATEISARENIQDFIDASIWTTFAVLALCETENIPCGVFYMRFIVREL